MESALQTLLSTGCVVKPSEATASPAARTNVALPPRRTSRHEPGSDNRAASVGDTSSAASGVYSLCRSQLHAAFATCSGAAPAMSTASVRSSSGRARSRTVISVSAPSVSPCAGDEPHEIEARHVLHDASSRAHHVTRAPHELAAEHVIARRAERRRRGARRRRCDRRAERACGGPMRVEREPLALARCRALDLGERRAGARGEREVARLVSRDAEQRPDVERCLRIARQARIEPASSAGDAKRR